MAYGSPRTKINRKDFYNLVRNSKTFETDKITSELHLNQGGELLKVTKSRASLHIHEDSTSLRIYVPKNERNQEFCFSSKLPQLLSEWMMITPATPAHKFVPVEVVNVVQGILNVKSIAIPDVLDYHGICIAILGEEDDCVEEESQSIAGISSRSSRNPEIEPPRDHTPATESSRLSIVETTAIDTPPSSVHSLVDNTVSRNESMSYVTTHSSYASSDSTHQQLHVVSSTPDDDYRDLLRKVVDAARQTTLPSRGAFDMSSMRAILSSETSDDDPIWEPYRMRSASRLERDKRVGAAGELFVSILQFSSLDREF